MASYGPDAKDDDILSEAKEAFKEAAEQEQDNRDRAIEDLKFARLGEQWPDEIVRQRKLEGRPILTNNRMPSFTRQVVNEGRQNKPSIRVRPVDSAADVETAEIINGIIRNIEANSPADIAYDTALEGAVDMGRGYFRLDIDYAHDDTFDLDLFIRAIPDPLTVYGDPWATSLDGSDWNSAFVTNVMSKDRFEREYPDAEVVDFDNITEGDHDWWPEGKVQIAEYWTRQKVAREITQLANGTIVDVERLKSDDEFRQEIEIAGLLPPPEARIRTVQSYEVKQCLLTGAEVLSRNDWPGRYIPIIPVYGDVVNVEGRRHFLSMIHFAKDAQRQSNFWRTASTELGALAPKVPYMGPEGTFSVDPEKWATVNTHSWPYIEYKDKGQGPPQRQQLDHSAIGAMQQALQANDDMQAILGLYDPSLGQVSNETSGKAILARQREGETGTFHLIDNLNRAIRHAGKVMLDLIPHVWTEARVVRLLGEDGSVTQQQINAPVPVLDKQGQPQMQQDPVTGQPIPMTRIYDLRVGKYDLTTDVGPSYASRREEAANQMIEFVRGFPQAAPVIGDLLAKNLDWPGADEIAERLQALYQKTYGGDQDGIPPQVKAQIQQGVALIQQLQGELSALKADKAIDQMKARTDAFEAETDRMKVIGEYKINMLDQQWNWAQPHSIIEPQSSQPMQRPMPQRQNGAM